MYRPDPFLLLSPFISLSLDAQIRHSVYNARREVSHLVLIMVHGKAGLSFIASPKVWVPWYKTRLYFIKSSQKSEQQSEECLLIHSEDRVLRLVADYKYTQLSL